ncbi:MAG: Gfo/Idh/MocA family oxidoreductase, partial [Saprospiraceae bacterium]|nr:Gfo/Idh/MocA family oxidoreductase [Saprospiraceae bacterium]
TTTHYELAARCIESGKHLFIEKPLTHDLEEAKALLAMQKGKEVKIQVGHVERFNPALLALEDMVLNPMFVEAHRLAVFNPRGTDVSVVLDLMIHDLDILLSLVSSEVSAVSASGVAVVSSSPDIANARIEFENGCVANLTASRISLKQMRKVRLFQKDAYISLDFLEKQAQVVRMHDQKPEDEKKSSDFVEIDTPAGKKFIQVGTPPIEPVNAIALELESLAGSIEQDERPKVSIEDGFQALKLAQRILNQIDLREQRLRKAMDQS